MIFFLGNATVVRTYRLCCARPLAARCSLIIFVSVFGARNREDRSVLQGPMALRLGRERFSPGSSTVPATPFVLWSCRVPSRVSATPRRPVQLVAQPADNVSSRQCSEKIEFFSSLSKISFYFRFFFALFKLAGGPIRAIIARGSQRVPKDSATISL